MINKKALEKINGALQEGDKVDIARKVKLHQVTVYNFFGGKEKQVRKDTGNKIIQAALELINERKRKEKSINTKLNKLLD